MVKQIGLKLRLRLGIYVNNSSEQPIGVKIDHLRGPGGGKTVAETQRPAFESQQICKWMGIKSKISRDRLNLENTLIALEGLSYIEKYRR